MKHLQHVEDLVLFGKGFEAIDMLRRFNDMNPNIKYDGSPAVFVGRKKDGTPFIATKGIFNKTPKYFTNIPEIRFGIRDYELQNKLVAVWDNIDESWHLVQSGTMYHGDFLFDFYDLGKAPVGYYFQPNTIRYHASDPKIKNAHLGMAWHSKYFGDPDEGWEFQYGVNKFPQLSWIWEPSSTFMLGEDCLRWDQYHSVLDNAQELLECISPEFWVQMSEKSAIAFQRWYNQQLRDGKSIMDVVSWLCNKEVMALLMRLLCLPKSAERSLSDMMMVMYFITDAKMMILHRLNTNRSGETFIPDKEAFGSWFKTGHEGLVLNSPEHKIVTKLVDRESFTVANFNAKRDWHRG